MATTYQPLQTIRDSFINCRSLNAKRKSAVELLQETKSLYVKSEAVLDNEQRLVKSAKCDSQYLPDNSSKEEVCRRTSCPQRRSAKSCSEQLQVKLRRLLNGNSKENLADGQSWDLLDSKSCKNELIPMENYKTDFITDIQYQSLPDLSVSSKESISYIHSPPGNDMESGKSDEEVDDDDSDSDSSEKKMTISGAASSENVNTDSSEKSYGKPPSLVKSVSTIGGSAGKVEERLSSWTLERHKELPRSKSYVAEHQASTTILQEQLPHDLDVFFQNLGLSSEQYSAITCYNPSHTSSPVFFSCGGSTDDESYCSKAPRRWDGSGDTIEESANHLEDRRDTGVSIVEANARIVKWLCQLSTSTTNTVTEPKKIAS
uniref:Centrosome-associated FAM110 C-terminal domain-containing protein n=1 Tax=Triatoma infestans TaxID=30076 RepID=A0A023EZW1_TRIIF